MAKRKAKAVSSKDTGHGKHHVFAPATNKLVQEIKSIEEREYGLKEFLHGILMGLALGFIIGILLFKGRMP